MRENINLGLGDSQIALRDVFNLPFPHPPFFMLVNFIIFWNVP